MLDVAELRDTAEKLRAQIGDRSYEPTDASERAALITSVVGRREDVARDGGTNTRV